jgi:hypothetical protein
MILATQDAVHRALRQRLITTLGIPASRVYLIGEPAFAEAMDFAVQLSPVAAGATNEFNRSGLGFITERFAVTTYVRHASDNDIKQSRMIAGIDKGVMARQADVRRALIQDTLDGLLQVAIRLVSSGPVRTEPRSSNYMAATDIFVCSYALPWPVAGIFRYGFSATQPTWAGLTEEVNFSNSVKYVATANRQATTPAYLWFAIPADLHAMGVTIRTAQGLEPFYRTGFLPPDGPAVGSFVQDGVTYQWYRRAYTTTATSLSYSIEVG